MNEDRIQQLRSEALESARKWENLAAYHRSQGDERELFHAEAAASAANRYADILKERLSEKAGA